MIIRVGATVELEDGLRVLFVLSGVLPVLGISVTIAGNSREGNRDGYCEGLEDTVGTGNLTDEPVGLSDGLSIGYLVAFLVGNWVRALVDLFVRLMEG